MNLEAAVQSSLAPPSQAETIPVQIRPSAPAKAAPYVVPVDPSAPRLNPYFDLAEKDDDAPLQMDVPYIDVASDPNLTFTIAPPENAASSNRQTPVRMPVPQPIQSTITPSLEPALQEQTTVHIVEELPGLASGFDSDTANKESAGSAATTEPELSDSAVAGNAEAVAQAAPLEEEVIRWYEYPRKWLRGWDSHAEIGLDGSSGNSDTLALQTGLELKRKSEIHTFAIDADYRQANSRHVTTEDNGRLNIDYDRLLNGTPWSTFGKFGIEWDKFKLFDLRLNLNGGIGYYWLRQDDANLVTRFGAGASREFGAPDDDWVAEAVFGIDADRQLNSRNKLKAKVDYFPAWEDFGDYRLVADFAWEILLDDSENLSLKLAATDRYDSTPQGAKPNDVYYSLLLLYKF